MKRQIDIKVTLVGNYEPDRQQSMLRFAQQLKEGLLASGVDVEEFRPRTVFGHIYPGNRGIAKWIGYIDKYLVAPVELRMTARSAARRGHVFHICDHSNAIYTKALAHVPHLVTCHDLLAVRSARGDVSQNKTKWTGRRQQDMILRGLKQSQMIVSVSKATQADVQHWVGANQEWQYLIHNSLDAAFIREAHQSISERKETDSNRALGITGGRPYVMHIGGEKWYKNRRGVLLIFAELAQSDFNLDLIVVGPQFDDSILKETGCYELKGRIHYLRDIDDDTLRVVYRNSEMLLFPSIAEGFGWPILEAQACGCPALTFSVEPMQSLNALPNLAVGMNPDEDKSSKAMARACIGYRGRSAVERRADREKIKEFAAQFSNESSVEAYIKLYRVLQEKQK